MTLQEMYALDLCETLIAGEETDETKETIRRMINGAVAWQDVYDWLTLWGYEWDEELCSWLYTGDEE